VQAAPAPVEAEGGGQEAEKGVGGVARGGGEGGGGGAASGASRVGRRKEMEREKTDMWGPLTE